MPSFLRFSKKFVYYHEVRIQVFLESLWKMAQKVHFLSDLGKIKPRNEEKRCILGLGRLTLRVWGHCGAQNMDFFIIEGCWSSDRYEGGLNLFYAPETDFGPRWTQTPEKDLLRHILTCFYHFWALFCLKPTRNALFTPFLSQNFPDASKMIIFCTEFA